MARRSIVIERLHIERGSLGGDRPACCWPGPDVEAIGWVLREAFLPKGLLWFVPTPGLGRWVAVALVVVSLIVVAIVVEAVAPIAIVVVATDWLRFPLGVGRTAREVVWRLDWIGLRASEGAVVDLSAAVVVLLGQLIEIAAPALLFVPLRLNFHIFELLFWSEGCAL